MSSDPSAGGRTRPAWHGIAVPPALAAVNFLAFWIIVQLPQEPPLYVTFLPWLAGYTQWMFLAPLGLAWRRRGDHAATRALWITGGVLTLITVLCSGWIGFVLYHWGPT